MKGLLKPFALCLVVTAFASSSFGAESSTANLRVSPFGLIAGSLRASLDFGVSSHWSLGPVVSRQRFGLAVGDGAFDIKSSAAGLRANWFANGIFTDGFYFAPEVVYSKFTNESREGNGTREEVDVEGANASVLIGYGWFWDSFNIMLGIGGQSRLGRSDRKVFKADGTSETSEYARSGFDGEFSFGWAF